MGSLDGHVAFITGAARGMGRAHAVKLAGEGADIVALDICTGFEFTDYPGATVDDLEETARLVRHQGRRILARQADVRDPDAVDAVLAEARREFGRLDIVIANAGIAPMETGDAGWRDVVDVNLTGTYHTAEVAIPTLIEQGDGGSIVLISSVAGLVGMVSGDPGAMGYTAAKHGIVGLMRQYANILAEHSIRVNSVHPTGVNTPMIDNDFVKAWLQRMGVRAGGNALPVPAVEPEDIANAVAWLVSDAARYVTGVTLPVDAGAIVKR